MIKIAVYYARYQWVIKVSDRTLRFRLLDGIKTPPCQDPTKIFCMGSPFFNWLDKEVALAARHHCHYPTMTLYASFKEAVPFVFGDDTIMVIGFAMFARLETTWFHKIVPIDVTMGMYDHLRQLLTWRDSIDLPVVIGDLPGKGTRIIQEKPMREFMRERLEGTNGCSIVVCEIVGLYPCVGEIPALETMIQRSDVESG